MEDGGELRQSYALLAGGASLALLPSWSLSDGADVWSHFGQDILKNVLQVAFTDLSLLVPRRDNKPLGVRLNNYRCTHYAPCTSRES